MDTTWGHYAKWNKASHKKTNIDDSTAMRYLEESSSEKQNAERWLLALEERKGVALALNERRVPAGQDE